MIETRYSENKSERILTLREDDTEVKLVTEKSGYGMVKLLSDTEEVERYYGFEMALDHAAEIFGVSKSEISVPSESRDMGI